jgi:hypothetical protein
MTTWTDFVKKFAAENNLSYGCALSTPACKAGYRATKGPEKVKAPKSYKAMLKKGLPKEPKAPKGKTKKQLQAELAKALSVPSFV